MTDQPGFYLGKVYDPATKKPTDEKVFYDPSDLTTHGFVTGMTGSGKTGLCIGLLEEAALEGIPAIMIDPKGDLTNLLLHFPELRSEDFKPWIDPDLARRDGKSVDQVAAETAENWRNGLAQWDLGPADLTKLKNSVDFMVYTPGSTSARPVSILSSFQAPKISWDAHSEVLREEISSIITGLLGLVGMTNIDPLRSREHILLANILEDAWSKGQSLDLNEVILRVQNPPFERLGAFPINNLFPAKDRMDLAMLLNNFLASPSFQTWVQGDGLDIQAMLYTPEGKPRHTIFYLAHLPDNERMFFVTLLFAAIESWMRSQRGTGSLRALIYFDEIVGYLPPVENPSSRPIILRMLKQARAFGVGLLLATQNPVDMDYKALSNAGTWFVGRLQTERDKMRLLDGLESARGDINRSEMDKILSAQAKRVFLLHNVHAKAPVLFNTRWAMNYLAGPLTRAQLPELNALAGHSSYSAAAVSDTAPTQPVSVQSSGYTSAPQAAAAVSANPLRAEGYQKTKGIPPAGFAEFYLPTDLGVDQAIDAARMPNLRGAQTTGIVYKPAIFAQAAIRYVVAKYGMELTRNMASLVLDKLGTNLDWEANRWPAYNTSVFQSQPLPNSEFDVLPGWVTDAKLLNSYKQDFQEWVYRNGTIRVKVNDQLKIYGRPDESEEQLRAKSEASIREAIRAEQAKIQQTYSKKLDALEKKIQRQEMEVSEKKSDVTGRGLDTLATGGQFLAGLFGGRKRSISSSISKARMANTSRMNLKQEQQELDALEQQLEQMEKDMKFELDNVETKWKNHATAFTEVPINPTKTNIFLDQFGIAWVPFYILKVGESITEILATDR